MVINARFLHAINLCYGEVESSFFVFALLAFYLRSTTEKILWLMILPAANSFSRPTEIIKLVPNILPGSKVYLEYILEKFMTKFDIFQMLYYI